MSSLQRGGEYEHIKMQDAATAVGNGTAYIPTAVTRGNYNLMTFQVSGISGDTLIVEGTINGTDWATIPAYVLGDQSTATSITANGLYRTVVTGLRGVRVRVSTYGAGTIYVDSVMSATGELGSGAGGGNSSSLTVETRANILALTPTATGYAFSSDTNEAFLWDGSAWWVAPLELNEQPNAIDMGLLPPMVTNDRSGYTAEYITDKIIYNSLILGSAVDEEGSVRTVSGAMQVYLNGTWNHVVTGFRFREDDTGGYQLEHKPIGFTWWVEVANGNSDELGLNGLPLAQGYAVSMGAYPVHEQIVGRTIDA